MMGVMFIVCIPKPEHESVLKKRARKRVLIKGAKRTNYYRSKPRSSNASKQNSIGNLDDEDLVENSPIHDDYEFANMEKLVQDILKSHNIQSSASTINVNEKYVQIMFSVESGEKCEEILNILREHKIGQKYYSTIAVVPCSLFFKGSENSPEDTSIFENLEENKIAAENSWTRFISSVRARLTVAHVVEVVKAQSTLTFDFICLLIIASILCAIGLVENSNVYLLSSMLISPMMGPVMAGTFGTVIRERMLQKLGVQSGIVATFLSTLVGFSYGTIICLCTDKYGENEWPTNEMISRGEVRTLGVGCLIALLSGCAVAVGVLSDNVASLVGVAISTSLMPPAVNAGLLWSLASIYYLKGNETTRYAGLSYTEYYSEDRFLELSALGGISFCLTLVNIVCIYLGGILLFKVKEVAPISSRDPSRARFWKHDIKVARDYNKTLHREENLNQKQVDEDLYDCKKKACERYEQFHHSSEFSRDDIRVHLSKCQQTWSPCVNFNKRSTIEDLQDAMTKGKVRYPTFPASRGTYRKLSQLFENTVKNDDALLPITEVNVEDNIIAGQGCKKKFTVTPTTIY